jgi:hypothetical protein
MRNLIKLAFVAILFIPSLGYGQAWSGILNASGTGTCTGATPTACAVDWSTVGIPGGIPVGTQSGSTITSTGSDQTSAINTALAACGGTSSAEKFVNLAAGTFVVTGQLTVPSFCYLNGQGANQTILNANGTSGNGVINLGSALNVEPSISNDTAITAGLSAGSTSITVASASHISVGSLLTITELNSLANHVNSTGSEGFCNFCDPYGGFRSSGQTVLVTGVSGTTITISPGLYWTFGPTLPSWAASSVFYAGTNVTSGGNIWKETATPASPFFCTSGTTGPSSSDGTCAWTNTGAGTTTKPTATPFTPVAIKAGVENLQIFITNAGTTTLVGPNVNINQCEYCFEHGVEDNYTDADHIVATYDYGGEVSENYFSNAILHEPGTYDSAVQVSLYTSKFLIQNNIFERGHVGILFEHGPSGNVSAYNYMLPGFDSGSPAFVIGGFDYHGAHSQYNLMEGNIAIGLYEDSVWGTSTNQTSFRNWIQGSGPVDSPIAQGRKTVTSGATVTCDSLAATNETCFPFQASRAMQISYLSTANNLIGNVVGSVAQSSNIGNGTGSPVTPYNSGANGQTDANQWPSTQIFDDTVYAYAFGYGESADSGTWPLDSTLAFTTSLLHGNYGNISNAIVWSGSLTHTLPASLYLSSKPSWWGTGPFPAIGPDVTGGVGPGAHTNVIPAENCFVNVMGGSTGAGSPLSFNASTCFAVAPANTTWFIRHDGGTNTQCTGTTNAAYPGTGSAQPCAYNHPFQMLNSAGNFTAMIGGDTIQFADPPTNTTPYFMGEQNNGVGTDWSSQIPSMCPAPNTDGVSCILPAFPSGTASAHTKIIGQNAGSCHTLTPNPGLVTPTLLSGINDAFRVFNLQGTDFVDISCIAIVQPDTCTLSGPASNPIDFTVLGGGSASYIWHNTGVGNLPLNAQNVTITGTTNDGGALNLVGAQITSVSPSTLNITQDQVTSTTTAVFTYTVASGEAPIVGQTGFSITGLTSGGGQLNTSFGNGTISAVTGTTSGTFTVTASSPTWTVTASQSETGTFTNFVSGTFTIALSGSAAKQAETGTQIATGSCTQANNYARTGINFELDVAQGPSNYTLTDVAVVGLASRGTLGGAINTLSTDVSSESYVFILGNGFTGKDGDGGGCDTSCEDVGTVNVDHEYIEWNGCVAKTKNPVYGGNTVDLCYGQGSGGQGDGWVAIAAGNVTFNITNSFARYNTQDGFDLLHLSDDLTTSPIVNISKSRSEGNLGQTFKIGAGASATAINNVSVANCAFITTASNFPTFPSSFAAGIPPAGITGVVNADVCRADGDQWALNLKSGATVTIENNTSVGYGATAYDFELGGGATTCTSCTVIFKNNITKGYTSPVTGIEAAGVFIGSGVSSSFFTSSNNNWNTIRTGCPDPTLNDTSGVQCGDPNLVSESNVNAINPNITAASTNVLHLGTPISGITTDFNGTARPNPPSIGAFEPQPTTIQPPIQLTGKITISGKIQLQ